MSNERILFEGYLRAFIRGKLKLEKLLVEFAAAIARNEANRNVIAALVEASLVSGDLPTAAYRVLRRELRLPQGDSSSLTQLPIGVGATTSKTVALDDDTDMIPLDDPGDAEDTGRDSDFFDIGSDAPASTSTAEDDVTAVAADTSGSRGTASGGRQHNDATQMVSDTSGTGASSWDPSVSTSAPQPQSTWSDPGGWSSAGDEILSVGSVIKDRFKLVAHIGKGGMGEVFKAIDQRKVEAQDRDPYVAVKVLNDEFKKHPKALQALQREARKTQELAHPNIMTVYDFDRQGTNVYMTMEFLDGEPMDVVLKKRKGEPFPEEEALKIIGGMAEALAYAHRRGLVHSDFKPGNVFLRRDGTIKVLDFGIAARVSRPISDGEDDGHDKTLFDVKQFGAFTPAYASCEIMEGNEPDPRDDIYALACVAYQLLGGKHPYNRKRATFARDNGMKPEPIPTLARSQMRALERGLAFSQADRTATVEEFLEGLQRRKSRTVPIAIGAIAASVVLVIALSGPIMNYLDNRREQALLARITSGDSNQIASALGELGQIEDQDLRRRIIGNARDTILAFYAERAEASVDDSRGQFDYPAAERLIAEARQLYPDSAQLERVNDQIASRKSRLLNDLTSRFNDGLQAGRLLPEGQDSIPAVLAIVAQVNPDHPLLNDGRLTSAYAREASAALSEGNLDLAEQLTLAGLARFGNDPALINLEDEIGAQRTRREEAQQIAAIEAQLKAAGLPEDLETLNALRESLVQLQTLRPNHELLIQYRARTEALITPAVSGVLASRAWNDGRSLLAAYEPLLPPSLVDDSLARFNEAETRYGREIDRLMAEFEAALGANHLAPPDDPNASDLLGALVKAGGEDPRVVQARARLAQSYLALARRSRAQGDWDEARRLVETGLRQAGEGPVSSSLNTELAEIARAQEAGSRELAAEEKAAAERERQAQLTNLYATFGQTLDRLDRPEGTPGQVVDVLDQIAALNPTDPMLEDGRRRLAEKISAQATTLAERGELQAALATIRTGLRSVPESDILSRQSASLNEAADRARAAARESQIAALRTEIEAALADPSMEDSWQHTLRDNLQQLARLVPANDAWRAEVLDRVVTLYTGQAETSLQQQRFAEARALLESGQRLTQRPGAFDTSLARLENAETAFQQAAAERAKAAEIEGRKQTLLTQAQANDVRAAVATLDLLKQDLPANDPFLETEAPEAIADAYLKLANGFAQRQEYRDAMRLINAGLGVAPKVSALRDARQRFGTRATLQELRDELARTEQPDGEKIVVLRDALSTLRATDEAAANDSRTLFIKLFQGRIESLNTTNPVAAALWNAAGSELFPNAGFTARTQTEQSTPATSRTPASTAAPANAAPSSSRSTSGNAVGLPSPRPCETRLAGYGKDSRGTCFDLVAEKVRGPLMVVVPGSSPFAITKYEVTLKDYNAYCYLSKECSPVDADGALPVTGITYGEAARYAAWLSERTGLSYRLPSESEWTYAAKADGGDNERGNYNCLLKQGSSILRGGKLLPVNAGAANSWGLVHSVGNAQEWIGDGSTVVGGTYQDPMSNCDISLKKIHDGSADQFTGFRLVRDLSDS